MCDMRGLRVSVKIYRYNISTIKNSQRFMSVGSFLFNYHVEDVTKKRNYPLIGILPSHRLSRQLYWKRSQPLNTLWVSIPLGIQGARRLLNELCRLRDNSNKKNLLASLTQGDFFIEKRMDYRQECLCYVYLGTTENVPLNISNGIKSAPLVSPFIL